MRKFLAACCCAIVGLEVLIAVPLITCLVVLGVVDGMDVPQVAMDVHAETPQYTGTPFLPPPPLSPAGFSGPMIGPPPPPISYSPVCASLPPCPVTDDCPGAGVSPPPPNVAAVAPTPLSPQVEAIAEAHDRLGSPLAESSLAGDPAATRADTIAVLEQVAAQDSARTLPPPEAPTVAETLSSLKPTPEVAGVGECPAKPSLAQSLRVAADQLYVKAQELEIDGNFSRADQLRTLARGIRTEIDLLRRETNPPAPTLSAVTEASLVPQPVSRRARVETVNPLEPVTVGLVRPASFDAPIAAPVEPAEAEEVPQIPAP